jgi:hypothetical protein
MLQENVPYGLVSRYNMHNQASLMMLEAAYRAGDDAMVKKIGGSLKKDIDQQMAYYASLDQRRSDGLYAEIQYATRLQSMLQQMEQYLNPANAEKPAVIQTR